MIPLEMLLTFFQLISRLTRFTDSSQFLNLRAEENGGLLH